MKQFLAYKNGLQLAYVEYGSQSGYSILVQHGLIASIDDDYLFDCLIEKQARVICVARPGYGESSPYAMQSYAEWAEITSRLVQELQLEKFDVLGMSSGAPYAYAIGHQLPGQVRNIFIFSGTPALYDEIVLAHWPYRPTGNQSLTSLETLAHQLFFSDLTEEDLKRNDIHDSLMNNAFGVAQDMRLRFLDWGFRLEDVRSKVFMRHSKTDDAVPFYGAVRTAELIPDCQLELLEDGPHFSVEALNQFINATIVPNLS